MEERIKQLYENINYIGYCSVARHKNNYVESAKALFPEINAFCEWFLSGNQFGIEMEIYQALKCNLLDILQDIVTAAEENDEVLMLDALEYGIGEYLTMLLPEEYFKEREEQVIER